MKDPLEYLNDVKIDLSEYEEVELNEIEEKKMKKLAKKSISKAHNAKKSFKLVAKVSGLVVGISVCTLAFGFYFPTYAEKIPILKDVYELLYSPDKLGDYEEYSEPVVAEIKVDGYEISIEKAYYNGLELSIIYKVIGDEPLEKERMYAIETAINTDDNMAESGGTFYGEFVDDYTFEGTIIKNYVYEGGSESPKIFNGNIILEKLYIGSNTPEYIDINSEPIQLTLDSSNIEFKEYEIDKEIIANGRKIEVLNAKEYPTGLYVEFKDEQDDGIPGLYQNYWIWDSNKGNLEVKSHNPNNKEKTFITQFMPSSDDGEVFLIPFEYDSNEELKHKAVQLEKGKYDFGNKGSIEILDVTDVDDKTEIRVRTTGNYAAYSLSFEGDGDYEYYDPTYKKDEKILGVLDKEITYVYEKLDRNINYNIIQLSDSYKIQYDQMIKIK